MKQVPFTNTSGRIRTVARQMVTPGETIYIDERDHPDYTPPKQSGERPRKEHSDPVLKLLDSPVADIVPQLPGLSDEAFDKLQQAERDGKSRKSLKAAFDEEYKRRAAARLAAAGEGTEGGTDDATGEDGKSE